MSGSNALASLLYLIFRLRANRPSFTNNGFLFRFRDISPIEMMVLCTVQLTKLLYTS